MELSRSARMGVDISSEAEVLTWTHDGDDPIEVIARIDLGRTGGFLSRVGGTYQANMYLNDTVVVPLGDVQIAAGQQKAIVVSKAIPLEAGDKVVLKVVGLGSDTSIGTVATLRDATPIRKADVLGPGSVRVDHDYPTADALAIRTTNGTRVSGVSIRVYQADDYDAGRRGASYALAETLTDSNGRWVRPLLLDPSDYVLLIFASGRIKTTTHRLTVAAE